MGSASQFSSSASVFICFGGYFDREKTCKIVKIKNIQASKTDISELNTAFRVCGLNRVQFFEDFYVGYNEE